MSNQLAPLSGFWVQRANLNCLLRDRANADDDWLATVAVFTSATTGSTGSRVIHLGKVTPIQKHSSLGFPLTMSGTIPFV